VSQVITGFIAGQNLCMVNSRKQKAEPLEALPLSLLEIVLIDLYFLNFLLKPIRPIKPEPRSKTAEGIGTKST
jgi:hypothetical protein